MDTILLQIVSLQLQSAITDLDKLPDHPAAIVVIMPELSQSVGLPQYAEEVAKQHGLNAELFNKVITCESQWKTDVRSNFILKSGKRENSWGLVQINLDDPPTGPGSVTLAQAKDPYFAINYMADRWDEGLADKWTCYRQNK